MVLISHIGLAIRAERQRGVKRPIRRKPCPTYCFPRRARAVQTHHAGFVAIGNVPVSHVGLVIRAKGKRGVIRRTRRKTGPTYCLPRRARAVQTHHAGFVAIGNVPVSHIGLAIRAESQRGVLSPIRRKPCPTYCLPRRARAVQTHHAGFVAIGKVPVSHIGLAIRAESQRGVLSPIRRKPCPTYCLPRRARDVQTHHAGFAAIGTVRICHIRLATRTERQRGVLSPTRRKPSPTYCLPRCARAIQTHHAGFVAIGTVRISHIGLAIRAER